MPNIDDVNQKKRFKKKAYRPWNLLDEPSSDLPIGGTDSNGLEKSPQDSSKLERVAIGEISAKTESDNALGLPPRDIASKSPATNQQIASISPAISPATNQQIASTKNKVIWQKTDIASISPAISPADTPANRQQPTSKSPAIWNIAALSGKEALLLNVIFQHCKNTGSLSTENIGSEQLAEHLRVSTKRLNNLVERLLEKRLIEVPNFKPGRGSWRKFRLNDAIYREAAIWDIASKSPATNQQIASIPPAISPAISPAEPPSSSSFLRSITNKEGLLTTGEVLVTEQLDLNPVWQKIDYSSLVEIRFGRHQVAQIAREGKFTPEELQDSIDAFAFDLSENEKAKTITGAPLNYFMGILRRGPYAAPSNYESPDVRQKRLYLESKEQQRKKRQELEERFETVEFEEWLESLSFEQRAELVPPNEFAKPGSVAHNYQMREYYREQVWPERRGESQRK